MQNLKLLKKLGSSEVFDLWRREEAKIKHWKPFWESKGFKSWEKWRKTTHKPLFNNNIKWQLYKINDPTKTTPKWRGIMSHSWNKWFYGNFKEKPPRLEELVSHPGVHNHWFVQKIKNNFAKKTHILALQNKKGEIMIAEGMHRACALAVAAYEKKQIKTDMTVALGKWPFKEWPKLGTGWNKK